MNLTNMTRCALLAGLLCICAWLSVPFGGLSFTMQTFGVFLSLGLLGGKYGTLSIALYLLLGLVGLPVFSGFRGGIGVLLGASGGYIFGFLVTGLCYWLFTACLPKGKYTRLISMVLGLFSCYAFGSLWFWVVYGGSLVAILSACVLPYLLPDGIKLALALFFARRLQRFV